MKVQMENIIKLIHRQSILSDANLSINNQEISALIGPNGAGKTTLIKCLLGFLHIDGGIINIDGQQLNRKNINTMLPKFGVVIKYPESISDLPINYLFKQHAHYMGVEQKQPTVSLLKKVKLNIDPTTKAGKLSLGMKQRLLLALAISHNPSLVILDEPFNGLDIDGVDLFKSIIKDIKHDGKSVLITSHSLNELNDLVDSITFIDQGKTMPKVSMATINRDYQGSIKKYYKEVHHA